MRRRFYARPFSVSGVLQVMNTILHERQLESISARCATRFFDFKAHTGDVSNSGWPYPIHCTRDECTQIELPGVPLGFVSRRHL
jgi:hypothetical protein